MSSKSAESYPNFESLLKYMSKIKMLKPVASVSGYKQIIIYAAIPHEKGVNRLANMKVNINESDALTKEFKRVEQMLKSHKEGSLDEFPYLSRLISLISHVAAEVTTQTSMEILVYASRSEGSEQSITSKELTSMEVEAIMRETKEIMKRFGKAA